MNNSVDGNFTLKQIDISKTTVKINTAGSEYEIALATLIAAVLSQATGVTGPEGSFDNQITVFKGSTGAILKGVSASVSDSGVISGAGLILANQPVINYIIGDADVNPVTQNGTITIRIGDVNFRIAAQIV